MPPISGFGHFFGFAAEINFATSIFGVVENYILSLLSEFAITKLSQEKAYAEQAIPVYEEILDRQIAESEGTQQRKLMSKRDELIILRATINSAENAAIWTYDDLQSKENKTTFDVTYKPLFPLSGTYSAIFLLFTGFCEYNEKQTIICYNTMLLVSIFSIILSLINLFGLCGIKEKDSYFRLIFLNVLLILSAFIFWRVSHFIKNHPSIQFGTLDTNSQKHILYFTLFTSVFSFVCLFIKITWVNSIVRIKYYKFKIKNRRFSKAMNKIINTNI